MTNERLFSVENIVRALAVCGALLFTPQSFAAAAMTQLTQSQYEMLEPYLNQTLKEKLNPKNSGAAAPSATRKVVPRAAAPQRAVLSVPTSARTETRRVVARRAANGAAARAAKPMLVSPTQSDTSTRTTRGTAAPQASLTNGNINPEQCLAGYTECMDSYCHRPKARYDRCYCSARLAQIDGEYKPAIESLVRKIAVMREGGAANGGMTDQELYEFWGETFDDGTGRNSMENLGNALNIDWATMESSVRGQNAFVAGDNYCKQHLAGCFYMAENMKSMYRSGIGQDCRKYETYLQRMKYAAEQIVGSGQ